MKERRRELGLVGLFFVLLSFAPVFLALAHVFPGLASMRVPTRGYPFVSLALVVLAARGLDVLLAGVAARSWHLESAPGERARHAGRNRRIVAAAIGLALCLELDTRMRWNAWPYPPEQLGIFREIARRPEVRVTVQWQHPGNENETRQVIILNHIHAGIGI